MNVKLIDAMKLHGIVSNIGVGMLESDDDKLKMIRLCVRLKKYARQWDETVEAARSMAPQAAQELIDKEAVSEVEIPDDMLIGIEAAEKLAVDNSDKLSTGALGMIVELLVKDE